MTTKTLNQVLVHVTENIDEAMLDVLVQGIRRDRGIVSVEHRPERKHLMLVNYDAAAARAIDILHNFRERGLHAQLIGM